MHSCTWLALPWLAQLPALGRSHVASPNATHPLPQLTLRHLLGCAFVAVVTIPARMLVWLLLGLAAGLLSLPGLVAAAISLPLRLFFGPLSQHW